jgi:hypothetical protein
MRPSIVPLRPSSIVPLRPCSGKHRPRLPIEHARIASADDADQAVELQTFWGRSVSAGRHRSATNRPKKSPLYGSCWKCPPSSSRVLTSRIGQGYSPFLRVAYVVPRFSLGLMSALEPFADVNLVSRHVRKVRQRWARTERSVRTSASRIVSDTRTDAVGDAVMIYKANSKQFRWTLSRGNICSIDAV